MRDAEIKILSCGWMPTVYVVEPWMLICGAVLY
jgi:hypothetical protein